MDVPGEILQTSMRTHQKYFALRDPKTGKLANRFALVANMIAQDGGKQIVAGNERVLKARLSDAKFFWDQDKKRTLESRVADLKDIVFHAKLGTQARTRRTHRSARRRNRQDHRRRCRESRNAPRVSRKPISPPASSANSPSCKASWAATTPSTTGKPPKSPTRSAITTSRWVHSDQVPSADVSIAVALADKIDTRRGLFRDREKPTGSGDPYALKTWRSGQTRFCKRRLRDFPLQTIFSAMSSA